MSFLRDVRFGFRILTRYPSFALAALSVIGLGVGATTAVFTVVKGVLLRPLPYRQPERIVLFRADAPGYAHVPALTGEEFAALRERADLFDAVATASLSEGNLTGGDEMEAVSAASASDNFFQALGIAPALGRTVSVREDIGPTWTRGVMISHDLWQRRFHGEPGIVGRPIEVNNIGMFVVGVLPEGFRAYLGAGNDIRPRLDIIYPSEAGDPRAATYRGYTVVARLRTGDTLAGAQAAVDAFATQFVASHAAHYRAGPVRLSLSTLDADVVSDVKPALVALTGAVAFVLLVACANLTNLLLARACVRTRELAVRTAIGASRVQVIRQLAAESFVIGGAGAAAGLLLAQWGVDVLLRLAPASLPRREAIAVDAGVAAFAAGVSLLSSLVVGLIPAWQTTRSDVTRMLKQDPASARGAAITRGMLVASQLALSLILLVGAGLMIRAFVSMRLVPLGFDPARTVTMNVHLDVRRFATGDRVQARAKRRAFYTALQESIARVPGVEQVGLGSAVPLDGSLSTDRVATSPGEPERAVASWTVFPGLLDTLRVPLVAGRYFDATDEARAEPAVIVDRNLADLIWPGQDALGRRLLLSPSGSRPQWTEVVGVVAHVQSQGLRSVGLPQIWVTSTSYNAMALVVRARRDPLSLVPAIRAAVQALGPGRPVHDIRLLDAYVADASADTRFALFVLAAFAGLALVLTAIGVYGIVVYSTARRTREIAVRLALGAGGRRIVGLVLREGIWWIAGGLLAGAVVARWMTKYLESLLFAVTPTDALTFASVVALLGVVAVVASVVPALRAVRVDPMLALRTE